MRSTPLVAFLAVCPALAEQVGFFESDNCPDASGMKECYEDAESAYNDCINSNCEDQGVDCHNVCTCIHIESRIDCAGAHCWNQVYSCEYQQTVNELADYCLDPRFNQVPFYPAPDDAPHSCDCNLGKMVSQQQKLSSQSDTCGTKGEKVADGITDVDEMKTLGEACICCAESGMLSAIWNVCPDHDPALLGADDLWGPLIGQLEWWDDCPADVEQFSCNSTLGYTAPGNEGDEFYFAEWPKNGTKTTVTNVAGAISTPISGEVYTYTRGNFERVVTVMSADAKPTSNSSSDDDDDNDSNDDSSSSSSSDEDGTEDEDEEDGAVLNTPKLMFLGAPLVVAFVAML